MGLSSRVVLKSSPSLAMPRPKSGSAKVVPEEYKISLSSQGCGEGAGGESRDRGPGHAPAPTPGQAQVHPARLPCPLILSVCAWECGVRAREAHTGRLVAPNAPVQSGPSMLDGRSRWRTALSTPTRRIKPYLQSIWCNCLRRIQATGKAGQAARDAPYCNCQVISTLSSTLASRTTR